MSNHMSFLRKGGARALILAGVMLAAPTVLNAQDFNPDESKAGSGAAPNPDVRPSDVVHWQVLGANLQKNGLMKVGIRLVTEDGWTLYKDRVKFETSANLPIESMTGPQPLKVKDPMGEAETEVYSSGEIELTLRKLDPIQADTVTVKVTYTGCTSKICLFPFTETLTIPVFADKGAAVTAVVAENNPPATIAPADSGDVEARWASELKTGGFSLGMMFLVFLGGVLTNLTPCVFPMIPITIRLLSAQGSSALAGSTMYAAGILVSYTTLGVAAAMSGALFGALLASTAFNVIFAGLMLLLGITMLGFGDLSIFQRIGGRIGAGKPSLRNSFLMGSGAGLVAAPCTGPILAALLAYTAEKQDIVKGSLMMAIYSFGFALPYVFLGGAAAKVTKIKLPPQWQVAVKYVFSGVMFGLFFYYMRIPAYHWLQMMRPYWMQATFALLPTGTVLVALWVLAPSLQEKKFSTLIPTLVLGLGLFAMSQWLANGSFDASGGASASGGGPLQMYHTESEGFTVARDTGKPILVDAWAEWCEACKKMDKTTFQDSRVVDELRKKWVVVKLDLTETSDENEAIIQKYGIPSLPTLTLLPPGGDLGKKRALLGYTTADSLLQEITSYRWE